MVTLRVLSTALPLTAALVDVVALIVVLMAAKDRRTGGSFAVMAAAFAVWHLMLGIQSIPGATTLHRNTIDLLRFGTIIMPATVYQNAFVWSGIQNARIRVLLWIGYALALFLCACHARGLLVDGFVTQPWVSAGRPGPLYPAYVVFSIGWIGGGCVLCVHALRRSQEAEVRLRAKYWLLGAAVAVPFGLANFALSYGVRLVPLSGVGNTMMVVIVAYAAVQYRLMDIDVFVMRTAATLLAGVAVILPVTGAVIWAQHLPFGVSGVLVTGCLLLTALVSWSLFVRFRFYLEREVEGSLFPARRAARDAIRQLGAELVELSCRDDLGRRVTATLMKGLGINGVALYFSSPAPGAFTRAETDGTINAPECVTIRAAHAVDGLARKPPSSGEDPYGSCLDDAVRRLHWEARIPIPGNGSWLGFIALGPKRTGAAIDDSDVTLVTMVAAQLAIALKNADYVRRIEHQKVEIEELRKRLEVENVALRAEVQSASQFKEIIGSSPALQRVLAVVERTAPTGASILITGETGTGKELIARAIHDLSPRRNGPFISVNCPAIPPGVAESELFGHERGAFTDAIRARPGKFELADGGTIFLDEVAELSPDLQVKLLRVLQERETQRVGGSKVRKLDLRVVAATNRNLHEEMRAQRFRNDLYYRLAAVPVHVPPLRERLDDVPMLATFFLERAATMYQKTVTGFTAEALAALRSYSWPGNIRELQHVVERAVLLCRSDIIKPEHLSDLAAAEPGTEPLSKLLRDEKLHRVEQALGRTGGNQAAAARLLGMSRSNFVRLLKSLGLKAPSSMQ